jgi:ankyrin repeat protein
MPASESSFSHAAILLAATALGLCACAGDPAQRSYRQRLEAGYQTPEDLQRFRSPEPWQQALAQPLHAWQPWSLSDAEIRLQRAAQTGDVVTLKAALAAGARVNAAEAGGPTAMLRAAREGQLEVVRLLLKAGASPDGRDDPMTPLAAAAVGGHTPVIQLLLRAGADINAEGRDGLAPLVQAVRFNRLDAARALLKAGASPRARDRSGDGLLMVAIQDNHPLMLSLLLEHGLPADQPDANGLSPLYWAEYLKRPELVRRLQVAGADASQRKTLVRRSEPYWLGEY